MKLAIRHCNKCNRTTLQARTDVYIGYDHNGNVYEKMWYCSNCNSYWQRVTKTEDQKYVSNNK